MTTPLNRTAGVGPDIASVARLFGDNTRVTMLNVLVDGHAMAASQLALIAGVSQATASSHLAQMVEQGLLAVERSGRHVYYRLASADVAVAVEALAALAPIAAPTSLRASRALDALSEARTCYDHVAGRLGVALADALERRDLIRRSGDDGDDLAVNTRQWDSERPLGICCTELPPSGRPLIRPCLDWSERRNHVAGRLASMLCAQLFDLGWIIRPRQGERAIQLTDAGTEGLRQTFGLGDGAFRDRRDDGQARTRTP